MDYPAQRRDQVIRFVREQGLDGFLVSNPISVTYLTGFSGDSSYLQVGRDDVLLVSDGRYEQQLKEECPGLPVHLRPLHLRITRASGEVVNKLGWREAGFESSHLTVSDLTKLQQAATSTAWKPCEETIEKLRIKKDPSEIAAIREAIGIAERVFAKLRQSLRPGDTEKQLSDRIEMLIRAEGGRCSSFPAIVGVDERAALPHAPLTDRKIGDAELLLVDWGASGRFYKSDLTRVLAGRKISPKLEQVYEVVLTAQTRAIERIRPGVKALDVDAEARSALEEAGFGKFFNHGLGHGIGLEVHEYPAIRPQSETLLEPGMVFTIEPGVYLPDWGGVRIEDDVLVTQDGCEVLTDVSKDLRSLTLES